MESFFHAVQHSVSHFWCCYWPTIKAMIIPGMGILGTFNIIVYKVKEWMR